MSATKEQAAAVQAVLAVDGWCEELPIANCMHCPIVCYVDDSNEDIARKAGEWMRENWTRDNPLASQSIDKATSTDS